MAKSQTNYATNIGKGLANEGLGLEQNIQPELTGYLGGLGGVQGQQQGTLSTLFPALQQNLTTGGYDPTQLGILRGEASGLAQTGGYDPTQLAALQSGYSDLATTGGFTPTQANQFLQRGTEGTTSTYNILANQLKNQRAATGGLGAGGEEAQMARQLSQAQGENTLNSQVALNQLQTQNKLAGLGGGSTLAGQVAGAKQNAFGLQSGLESGVAGGVGQAAGQLGNLYNTQTGQITAMGQQLLSALGLSYNSQAEGGQILAKLSQNPGLFSTILGDLQQLGGAAAGAAGALGVGV